MSQSSSTPAVSGSGSEPLIAVDGLTKHFDEGDSLLDRLLDLETPPVRAVDGVSFEIDRGQTIGLVGESGCGKSTVGLTALRLLEPTAGETRFRGENIYEMGKRDLARFRRNAQIVFQDPFASLNPRMTIGDIVREPLEIHGVGSKSDRREKVEMLLDRVGLSPQHRSRYPHEFSGGQRQRICIARALALEPEFVVLDEPVSSLDVSVQAQILNMLSDLQDEFDLTYLFIAHDLGVVKYLCDTTAVMYLGQIVEIGPTERIFEDPQHPYTQALLESIPRANISEHDREITGTSGDVPSPRNPPAGCSFHTRCPKVIQPPARDMPQELWRAVLRLREGLSKTPERFEDFEAPHAVEEDRPGHADRFEEILDAFDFPDDLPASETEAALRGAIRHILDGDLDGAAAELDFEFPTICRSDDPDLVPVGPDGHQSACYLAYDPVPDPPDRPAE